MSSRNEVQQVGVDGKDPYGIAEDGWTCEEVLTMPLMKQPMEGCKSAREELQVTRNKRMPRVRGAKISRALLRGGAHTQQTDSKKQGRVLFFQRYSGGAREKRGPYY